MIQISVHGVTVSVTTVREARRHGWVPEQAPTWMALNDSPDPEDCLTTTSRISKGDLVQMMGLDPHSGSIDYAVDQRWANQNPDWNYYVTSYLGNTVFGEPLDVYTPFASGAVAQAIRRQVQRHLAKTGLQTVDGESPIRVSLSRERIVVRQSSAIRTGDPQPGDVQSSL